MYVEMYDKYAYAFFEIEEDDARDRRLAEREEEYLRRLEREERGDV